MKTSLEQWRELVKKAGFALSIRSTKLGTKATYTHTESGQKLTFNVYTPELLERWKPLFKLITENEELIKKVRAESGAFGLKG